MKLLVIDDDPGVQRSLQLVASIEGWETFSCDQFGDIQGLIRDNAIDVVFCDYRLGPMITGLELLRQFRDAGLYLPVVMISANPSNVDRRLAQELDVHTILSKPADVKDVRKALADAAAEAKLAALIGNS